MFIYFMAGLGGPLQSARLKHTQALTVHRSLPRRWMDLNGLVESWDCFCYPLLPFVTRKDIKDAHVKREVDWTFLKRTRMQTW